MSPTVMSRARSVSAAVLIVIGCLLAMLTPLVRWVDREIVDTDVYVATVAPLADDPQVQQEVVTWTANAINQALDERVDLEGIAREALPGRTAALAPALVSGVHELVTDTTRRFVESDLFPKLWTELNRIGHQELVAILTGDEVAGVSVTERGTVVLRLGPVVEAVKDQLVAAGLTVVSQIPPISPVIELARVQGIEQVRHLVNRVHTAAWLLPLLVLVSISGGVALARHRRRVLVRAFAGVTAAMLLLLVAIALGRSLSVDSLPDNGTIRETARVVVNHMTEPLRSTARDLGLAALLVALVAGIAPPLARWVEEQTAATAPGQRPEWVNRLRAQPWAAYVAERRLLFGRGLVTVGIAIPLLFGLDAGPAVLFAVLVGTGALLGLRAPQPGGTT